DGLGPFLGVFLQEQSWSPAEIGFVMTIGGLVGMVAVTPAGMLVDKTTAKRGILVAAMVAVIAASLVILFLPSFVATSAAQWINAIAAAMMGPAVAAITLGLVKQQGYAHQLGRNEAFNHGGNVTAALLAGFFGYLFGLGAVFAVMAAMAVGAMAAVAAINPD